MMIRIAKDADVDGWAELRAALWPDTSADEHRREIAATIRAAAKGAVTFVAVTDPGGIDGFVEASLRHDYVNGCGTSPVTFVEGIYVRPERRGAGIGRALCAAVEAWGRARGCAELASDALLDNAASHAFHRAVGFAETERVVYFRKAL